MTTTAAAPAPATGVSSRRPCNRCREREATTDLRGAEQVCDPCFAYYVSSKAVKRLEALQRETAGGGSSSSKPGRRPRRYLVGLSRGASSAALLHVLTENARAQRARGGRATARHEFVAVHVVDDTLSPSGAADHASGSGDDGDDTPLAAYRARFPDVEFVCVPLSSALDLPASVVDWAALPSSASASSSPPPPPRQPPAHRLCAVLSRLPSPTSRADLRRLLTRHLLVGAAAARRCDALLLGHNATSLAALALAETAKGRGLGLPALVNDGVVRATPTPAPSDSSWGGDNDGGGGGDDAAPLPTSLPVYSPLRELFRKELLTYLSQAAPPLTDLVWAAEAEAETGAVVSHRDLSIDDVLSRYFAEVEASYPSVVANVVRTAGKLLPRPDHDHGCADGGPVNGNGGSANGRTRDRDPACAVCGAALDALGDERWWGEIGRGKERGEGGGGSQEQQEEEEEEEEEEEGEKSRTARPRPKPKLCYGCERSVGG
ncbi:hypothetical protein GGS23DRAFT_609627 [Durotheca rogersii]|uniref:uncharacterized protein n=1 Tax=Durotheca rogersii TaxID=419775 RepID=UPI002220C396|nr:uncharacterized protein GGS23DRAFT_609627 [Durotheca rogersii]KAI5863174.1 hypothetical protein GGS23DRAFT_609627 [Durotheca rogersii]